MGTIECFGAKQQCGSTRTFEVGYTDKQSTALATDFTAGDIFFTAAVPNALLCNQLITSISELLENDCSEEDNALVSDLQVGSSLRSCEEIQKIERMYNSINCVMSSYESVRNCVDSEDMLITSEKYQNLELLPPREWVMVLHPVIQRTSPVRLRKPHLPAALSTTRRVVDHLKASSITKTFHLKSGKLICTDTTLIQALNGVPANSERCGGMDGATHQMAPCQAL